MSSSTTHTFIDDSDQFKITYPNEKLPPSSSTEPVEKTSLIHLASYISIGTITLFTIGTLFFLFLFIKAMDDCIRIIAPERLFTFVKRKIDWTTFVDTLSNQLTHFAEWEKNKRTSWYSPNNPIDHEDKFQDLISTVTTFMNNYVHQRKQQQQQQDKTL